MSDNPPGESSVANFKWPAFWDQPTRAKDRAEVMALFSRCRERNTLMKKAIALARDAGKDRNARHLVRRYLRSFSAALHNLGVSYVRHQGSLRDASEQMLLDLVIAAVEVFPWKSVGERCVAWPQEKRDGGHRMIHSSGVFQYALERLAKEAADSRGKPLDTQFASKGGKRAREKWLAERLPLTKLVITVDIPRCFDIIMRSSVEDALLLPRRVVREVLFNPQDRAKHLGHGPKGLVPVDHDPIAKVGSASRGIAQGNALQQPHPNWY